MSYAITAAVWQRSQQRGPALLLLLALAEYADAEGWCFPAVETLAQRSRMPARQVRRHLATLLGSGELAIETMRGPGGVNRYRVMPSHSPGENANPLAKTPSPHPPGENAIPPGEKGIDPWRNRHPPPGENASQNLSFNQSRTSHTPAEGRSGLDAPPPGPAPSGLTAGQGRQATDPWEPSVREAMNRLVLKGSTAKWAGLAEQAKARNAAEATWLMEWFAHRIRREGASCSWPDDCLPLLTQGREALRDLRRAEASRLAGLTPPAA